jgi:phosphoserine aminotransferase
VKLTKWVDIPSMEVTIDISGDDAIQAITEDAEDSGWTIEARLKKAVNNLASFFKAVPAETIAGLTPTVRELIGKFLREQAERFWPNA